MNALIGRWGLDVTFGKGTYPSWVEITPEGGWFVGQVGSARPITSIELQEDTVKFSLPKQYEGRDTELEFVLKLEGDTLTGTSLGDKGELLPVVGHRAPWLNRYGKPTWSQSIELIDPEMTHWEPKSTNIPFHWKVEDGKLVNTDVGADIKCKIPVTDFLLRAEYTYPEGSNSGIYLRGRYEFQILDDEGYGPEIGGSAAVYGFLIPMVNAIKPANEWNVAEISLVGRLVTVWLNNELVHFRQEIPGITGGALDSHEGEPGFTFLQGDHGPVTFRRLTLQHAVW